MAKGKAQAPGESRLSAAIEAVHTASLDPELWGPALSAVTGLFNGAGCTLETFDKTTGRLRDYHAHGVPPASEQEYLEYWAERNPRAIHGRTTKPGDLGWDYQFTSEAEMDRDPYYRDLLLACTGFRYYLSATLVNSADTFAVLAMQYAPGYGHVQSPDIALMRRFLPHMHQAHNVARRLKAALSARQELERALDWLSDGVLLVGRNGKVLYANETMQAIARRGDGIAIVKGKVEFKSIEARGRFSDALARLHRPDASDEWGDSDFAVSRAGAGLRYLVSVRRLFGGQKHKLQHPDAAAVVFVHDPLRRNGASARMLQDVFAFTEAEAAIALALQGGSSLVDYARQRGLSRNTVYWHLRRIKEKTGCTRLPELILRLNEVQVAVRNGGA